MPKSCLPDPLEFRCRMVELIRAGRKPEELSREFAPSARAMPAVRFAVVLKVLGLNLLRAAAVRRKENGEGPAPSPANPRILDGIVSVHAQFMHLVRSVVNQLVSFLVPARLWAATAA